MQSLNQNSISRASNQNSQTIRLINWQALNEILQEQEQEIQELSQNGTLLSQDVDDTASEGTLWSQMKSRNEFLQATNFTENELLDIWLDLQVILEAHKTRGNYTYLISKWLGPSPKVCSLDAFLATLIWYKLGFSYEELAVFTHLPKTTLVSALERIHPMLLQVLRKRWENKPRPAPLFGTNFPHIGLLVDSTSMEVYRPKTRFEEAKAYWDSKNGIYALKKEVAVMARAPYYALFAQKGEVGSNHDYAIFKKTFNSYSTYLQKQNGEKYLIPSDVQNQLWSILGDKAYTGPGSDTPSVRRIFINKNPTSMSEISRNEELSKIRVHIECWFGRLKKLWKFAREVYKLDHKDFDNHFEILLYLTNEHIKNTSLAGADADYYRGYLEKRQKKFQEIREKRKASAERYLAKKRRRLQALE